MQPAVKSYSAIGLYRVMMSFISYHFIDLLAQATDRTMAHISWVCDCGSVTLANDWKKECGGREENIVQTSL
jgi:hypothetical protein